jgi:hypothetical protein
VRTKTQIPTFAAVAIGLLLGLGMLFAGIRIQTDSYSATLCALPENLFTGRSFNPDWNTRGARADVERTSLPALGTTGGFDTGASATVMLAGTGAYDGYAQIGYVKKESGTQSNRFFVQYVRSDFEDLVTFY